MNNGLLDDRDCIYEFDVDVVERMRFEELCVEVSMTVKAC